MKQKTAEEILHRGNTVEYWKNNAKENYSIIPISVLKYIPVLEEIVQAYAKQQQEIAVDKALEMCSNLSKEMIYDRDNLTKEESIGLILRNFQVCYATSKQEILSLKPEILKELGK